MATNQWILFLKNNKGKGKDISVLSKEYRELYKKTITYPYVRRDISEKMRKLCRGKSQIECHDAIENCYWKPKSNNCARRPNRSNQVNHKLQKNVKFNMEPEVFSIPQRPQTQIPQIREIRTNRKEDICQKYDDPLRCINEDGCEFVSGKCRSIGTSISAVRRTTPKKIIMDDVWGI